MIVYDRRWLAFENSGRVKLTYAVNNFGVDDILIKACNAT